jgi:hypothetical protein
MKRQLALVLTILVLGGSATATALAARVGPFAQDPCISAASPYGGTVTGSYPTTLGALRRLASLGLEVDPWVGESDASPAVLCYVDGEFPKGAPTTSSVDTSGFSNRAVIVILNGRAELIAVGNAAAIPIAAP